jgi:dipeptidyl aminopeptidase/acylaminoacyl peptidase
MNKEQPQKSMKLSRPAIVAFLIALFASGSAYSQTEQRAASIDDLVGWIQIPLFGISPNGDRVAYLTMQALPRENLYELTLNLIPEKGVATPLVLARYRLPATETLEPGTGVIFARTGQFAWAPDSGELVYTVHVGRHMELRSRILRTGAERTLVSDADRIELGKSDKTLDFTTTTNEIPKAAAPVPPDDAILVKDTYRFYGPLGNPKAHGKSVVQHWSYTWEAATAVMSAQDAPNYLNMPYEYPAGLPVVNQTSEESRSTGEAVISPDGKAAAMYETQGPDSQGRRSGQIVLRWQGVKDAPLKTLVPSISPRPFYTILGWSRDNRLIYYFGFDSESSFVNAVDIDGRIKTIYRDDSLLYMFPRSVAVDREMTTVILLRSTHLIPDELVAIDLSTGVLRTLTRLNVGLEAKAKPVIRLIPVESEYKGDAYGWLYLPLDYRPGKRYPLVITQYSANLGFFGQSVGDEVPIQTMVGHGIAILSMHSSEFNIGSRTGNFQLEINRVAKPLAAMEWAIRKLTDDGIIDPNRVGLTGLSYGAEIAMYAYWKSKAFKALSSAGGAWEPTGSLMGGPFRLKNLRTRGLPSSGDSRWKELSVGLNARADLPPLLWQLGDGETSFSVETWTRLRDAGAQVEWWQYPDEGHVKRGPANKWWVYQRNLDWFRFWLKDEEDPDPAKLEQYARWRQMREKLQAAKREEQKTVQTK